MGESAHKGHKIETNRVSPELDDHEVFIDGRYHGTYAARKPPKRRPCSISTPATTNALADSKMKRKKKLQKNLDDRMVGYEKMRQGTERQSAGSSKGFRRPGSRNGRK